ncbi:Type I phosphodiesterase/nucleotide pyrophosphatase/phosphate transferase [Trinorchestia longiramus]|nr:Type I phosphodiesterase/nucleotide pyrophosphatase/phosphate transferase [Trinorchestia longiramus]
MKVESSSVLPGLLVISLDGFSHDYLSKYSLPNIKSLFQDGSHPKTFMNQYPTETLPNHFSMATGLYVESHGVVGNKVYDPKLKRYLNGSDDEFFLQNKQIKPIWVVNEDHGGVSACLMWPGCGLQYHNLSETYHLPFNTNVTFTELIDTALTLLSPQLFKRFNAIHEHSDASTDGQSDSMPSVSALIPKAAGSSNDNNHSLPTSSTLDDADTAVSSSGGSKAVAGSSPLDSIVRKLDHKDEPANLVMLYNFQPDLAGHLYGPNSIALRTELKKIDEAIGYLLGQLRNLGLSELINVILLSDHGMTDVPRGNVIDLSPIIDHELYEVAGSSALLHIYANQKKDFYVLAKMQPAAAANHFTLLLREDLPENVHLRHNDRVPNFLLAADPGYVFKDFVSPTELQPLGGHGYNVTTCPEMAPFMVAVGPSFRSKLQVPEANNVDVFPLMCALLALPTPPNNGSLLTLELMMQMPPSVYALYKALIVLACVVGLALLSGGLYLKFRTPPHRHRRLRSDIQSLIGGAEHRASVAAYSRTPPIMLTPDELDEEEKLLSNVDVWEI